VGATFPEEALLLRQMMPRAIILVPGYGAQGGTAKDAVRCFDEHGLGAVINASRSITYSYQDLTLSQKDLENTVHNNTVEMIHEIRTALTDRAANKG
jgi:orotidine-5'-phosphate decarboxylase